MAHISCVQRYREADSQSVGVASVWLDAYLKIHHKDQV